MLSGRAMRRYLDSLGIAAQKVVRKRETGDYVADFFVPGMDDAVPPASQWARAIYDVLPEASIVDMVDTVASWRKGQPVIHATVAFQWEDDEIT